LKRTSCIFVIVIVNVIVIVIVIVTVIVTVIFTDSWAEIKFFVDFLAVMDIFTYICARF
jgi:hypothetical protein